MDMKRQIMTLDQGFKNVIHHADILLCFRSIRIQKVDEFKGCTIDEIKACLEL